MAIHHLVSRGLDAAHRHGSKDAWQKMYEIPGPALALIAATFFGYLLVYLSISYTYGVLVPNLIMTEAPSSTTVIKTSEYHDNEDESPDAPLLTKEEKEIQKPRDEEMLVIVHKPVTARFCSVVRHLRERTGSRLSRYRGVGGYLVANLVVGTATSFARSLTGPFAPLLEIPLTAALCLFTAAWVQQTVAMPGKNYFQRIGELRANGAWKKLAMPFLCLGLIEFNTFALPAIIVKSSGGTQGPYDKEAIGYIFLAFFLGFFTLIFTLIPWTIAVNRMVVALLPEETDTVIPIDRSLGGAETKDFRAVFKSTPRGIVWRLIKTYIKVAVMQITLALVALTLVVVELKVFAKPQFDGAVTSTREHLRI